MVKRNITPNARNRLAVGTLRTWQCMMINNVTLKRRELRAMPMQSTMRRMRKCSPLNHRESIPGRGRWRGRSRYGSRTAGAALTLAKPTRTRKEQLIKEPLRVLMHKVLLHQGMLPPISTTPPYEQQQPPYVSSKTSAVTIATSSGTFPSIPPPDRRRPWENVPNQYAQSGQPPAAGPCDAPNMPPRNGNQPHQGTNRGGPKGELQISIVEERAMMERGVNRCNQNWNAP